MKKTLFVLVTDGRTDGRTDRWTDGPMEDLTDQPTQKVLQSRVRNYKRTFSIYQKLYLFFVFSLSPKNL